MPAGQPTLLTQQLLEDVRRILPTVLYMETVGDYLGVSRITWRGWLKRGRKEHNRLAKSDKAKPKEREALYLEFFYVFKKGTAEGEIYDAGVIKKAAAEQWTAAAWRLERRFPERWGGDKLIIKQLTQEVRQLRDMLDRTLHGQQHPPPPPPPGGADAGPTEQPPAGIPDPPATGSDPVPPAVHSGDQA